MADRDAGLQVHSCKLAESNRDLLFPWSNTRCADARRFRGPCRPPSGAARVPTPVRNRRAFEWTFTREDLTALLTPLGFAAQRPPPVGSVTCAGEPYRSGKMSRMTKKTMVGDEALVAAVKAACGAATETATVHERVQALVRRASTARLIALAGSQPRETAAPRRRPLPVPARRRASMGASERASTGMSARAAVQRRRAHGACLVVVGFELGKFRSITTEPSRHLRPINTVLPEPPSWSAPIGTRVCGAAVSSRPDAAASTASSVLDVNRWNWSGDNLAAHLDVPVYTARPAGLMSRREPPRGRVDHFVERASDPWVGIHDPSSSRRGGLKLTALPSGARHAWVACPKAYPGTGRSDRATDESSPTGDAGLPVGSIRAATAGACSGRAAEAPPVR